MVAAALPVSIICSAHLIIGGEVPESFPLLRQHLFHRHFIYPRSQFATTLPGRAATVWDRRLWLLLLSQQIV